MKLCSFDARSEGQSGNSLEREGEMAQKRKEETLARANGLSLSTEFFCSLLDHGGSSLRHVTDAL
jgi:hypothetical protein